MTKTFMKSLLSELKERPELARGCEHITGVNMFDTLFVEASSVVRQVYRVLPQDGTKVLFEFPDLQYITPVFEEHDESFMVMFTAESMGHLGKNVKEFGVQINALEPGGETEQFYTSFLIPGYPLRRCYSTTIFTLLSAGGIGIGDDLVSFAIGERRNLVGYYPVSIKEIGNPQDAERHPRLPMVLSQSETQALSYLYYALAAIQTVNLGTAMTKAVSKAYWEILPKK